MRIGEPDAEESDVDVDVALEEFCPLSPVLLHAASSIATAAVAEKISAAGLEIMVMLTPSWRLPRDMSRAENNQRIVENAITDVLFRYRAGIWPDSWPREHRRCGQRPEPPTWREFDRQ